MIDCSKTENYLNEKGRMTKLRKSPHGGYLCTLKCGECPLSHQNNGTSEKIPCADFEIVYPLQAISIVQKWSNEHPQRTYLTEFLHHYPNVDLYENGIPIGICPRHLGLVNADSCAEKNRDCVACWNQSID